MIFRVDEFLGPDDPSALAAVAALAAIPVTPALARLIDATPASQLLIVTSAQGRPLTEERASKAVMEWRRKAGLGDDLRLYDARGTAATRLLRAGLTLNQIAVHMGWSLDHAAKVIEKYAAVAPEESDMILGFLARAEGRKSGTKL